MPLSIRWAIGQEEQMLTQVQQTESWVAIWHNPFRAEECKDLSKADVSVNIYAFLKAQETGKPVELFCAIGDTEIDGKPYSEIVEIARQYIKQVGGFEKFAEWGLF